jgi:hypothetical protein
MWLSTGMELLRIRLKIGADFDNRIVPIWLGILCVCLILTIAEVILFARLKLKPLHFLITNVIKSTIWLALFVLEIVSVVDIHQYHTASVPAIIIEGALLYVGSLLWTPDANLCADCVSGFRSYMLELYTTAFERKRNHTNLSPIRSRIFLTNTRYLNPNIPSLHNINHMPSRIWARTRAKYLGDH